MLSRPDLYEEVNIPKIPEELLLGSIQDIANTYKNVSPVKGYDRFESWRIEDKKFAAWAKLHFPDSNRYSYQAVRNGLKTHVDFYRREVYNYILDPGGKNVYTVFYDETHTKEIYRIKIPSRTWHKLNVKVPHNVIGITATRLAITIFEKTDKP